MRILITNDDGVHSSEIMSLARWAKKLGEVTVAAPKFEQSGKSHSIEIHKGFEALQLESIDGIELWSVDSTPADCVRFAVLGLKKKFDIVFSGINRGLNIGTDIMYSGTVGAAAEAVNLGIPAVAVSTTPEYYTRAAEHLDSILAFFREKKLMERCSLYNVNIAPNPKGILITHQGRAYYSDDFIPMGKGIYQPSGKCVWEDRGDISLDTDATLHGYISITPLSIDHTAAEVYRSLTE